MQHLNYPFLCVLRHASAGESMNRVREGNLLNFLLEVFKFGGHLIKIINSYCSINLFLKSAYQINSDNSTKAVSNNVDPLCFSIFNKFLPYILRMLLGRAATLWNRISE